MKKEKGFTLIELLAVLVILAVIALIATPIIFSLIESSKVKAYEQQKRSIIDAAHLWIVKNSDKISKEDETYINVNNLQEQGYLENREIKNPINGTTMLGCVTITYRDNQYVFDYNDKACSFDNNTVLRVFDNLYIQWKTDKQEEWKNFVSFSSLLGPQGEKGDKGLKGDTGQKGIAGPPGPKGQKSYCP